jgi:aldehyde:ferredoxin oxidoreductase
MIDHGYMGEYARVNLTTGDVTVVPIREKDIRPYVGCSGYAVKMLWDEMEAGTDPLGPDGIIIFATGPVAGTLCPSGGSYELCFKSPLTGAWCQSRSGGGFGARLKYAGYDFLMIEGKSERPVYLWVHDKKVEIRDAQHLWGHDVGHVTTVILDEIDDPDASVATIGRAGENLVRMAAVMNDRGRAAGRGGGGAVLGSKNLKAVVVNGSRDIKVADPQAFAETIVTAEEFLGRYPFEGVNQFGTPLLVGIQNAAGALPTRNFSRGQFEGVEMISGEALTDTHLLKRRACFGCTMGCGRHTIVTGGEWATPAGDGPEYETLAMFGSLMLNDDLPSILRANHLCNELGLDTVSTGSAIAFAMECYENGLLTPEQCGGHPLEWGDSRRIVQLVEDIALRRGVGDVLADGVALAAEQIGGNAADYAVHVKGMEVPAHEPRGEAKIMGLQYAVNPRGACHMHPNWGAIWDSGGFECGMRVFGIPWPPTPKLEETGANKGLAYRFVAIQGEISEIVGACVFHSWGADDACITPDLYARILRTLTGMDIDQFELFRAADRSWVMKRAFNAREGFRREHDTLPKRLREPLPSGPSAGQSVENLDGMLDEYYEACGWDKATGLPLPETLDDLGLGDVREVLWPK